MTPRDFVYCPSYLPMIRSNICEGVGYKTKEEAIKAHNDHINRSINHLKKKLL